MPATPSRRGGRGARGRRWALLAAATTLAMPPCARGFALAPQADVRPSRATGTSGGGGGRYFGRLGGGCCSTLSAAELNVNNNNNANGVAPVRRSSR
ncbi:unnamed protein product, partial [Ectocarpus sp. 4 AP-2014]